MILRSRPAAAVPVLVAGLLAAGCGTAEPAVPARADFTITGYAFPAFTAAPACGSSTPASSTPATSAAPAAAAPSSAAATPAATGSIAVADQTSDGKSVKVSSVDVEAGGQGGWIALHQDQGGKPGLVKYYVAVPAGPSSGVSIPTAGGITTGAYWPMLHVDDHTVGTYEFPQVSGADLPAKANGAIVMKKITVTVQ